MATTIETADQLLKQLHKIKFFDCYTDAARTLAEAHIAKSFATTRSEGRQKFLQRFPATATASLTVYGEWDGEPFEPLVESYAKGSFGMFRPENIKDVRDDENEQMTLSFVVGGKLYSATAETQGWVPTEFTDLIEQAVKETCHGLEFHLLYEGGFTDSPSFTFCKATAYKSLLKSKLLCDDHEIAFADEYE